jgi:hypothetical protein
VDQKLTTVDQLVIDQIADYDKSVMNNLQMFRDHLNKVLTDFDAKMKAQIAEFADELKKKNQDHFPFITTS